MCTAEFEKKWGSVRELALSSEIILSFKCEIITSSHMSAASVFWDKVLMAYWASEGKRLFILIFF